jgi:hypothetical protein
MCSRTSTMLDSGVSNTVVSWNEYTWFLYVVNFLNVLAQPWKLHWMIKWGSSACTSLMWVIIWLRDLTVTSLHSGQINISWREKEVFAIALIWPRGHLWYHWIWHLWIDDSIGSCSSWITAQLRQRRGRALPRPRILAHAHANSAHAS